MHILRILDAAEEAGYFIELPLNTRVTVNGTTYINETNEAEDEEDTFSPLMIGPLNRYTIIELLSQPIFFFRRSADLDFNDPQNNNLKNRPSQTEINRRHKLSNDAGHHVEINWTPLPSSSRTAPSKIAPPKKAPKKAPTKTARPKKAGMTTVSSKTTLRKIASEKTVAKNNSKYDDNWEIEHVPILDTREYLNHTLLDTLRGRYNEIVPFTLAAINERQDDLAGFSLDIGPRLQLPGRTSITFVDHPQRDRSVLLVVRATMTRAITVHIIDTMAWRRTRDERLQIYDSARELLIRRQWWLGAFKSAEATTTHYPNTSN